MRFLLAAATALLFALPAHGQNLEWSDFDIYVGGAGVYTPEYLGSDEYEFAFVPDAEIVWQQHLFLSTDKGAGIYLFNDKHFQFGISASPDFGRDEDDSDRLNGLGDIDLGWRGHVFGEVNYEPFVAGATGSFAFGGDAEGNTVNAYVGLRKQLTQTITGQMTVGTTWASGPWGQQYYGVTAAQAITSGLPQYSVGAGFRDAGVTGSVSYAITDKFRLNGFARWTHLLGDVADSPIVEEEDNLTLGLGLGYQFATSKMGAGR